MQDRQHSHVIGMDLVNDYEGQAGNDQFARARDTADPAQFRKRAETGNSLPYAATHPSGCSWPIPGDVGPNFGKVGECLPVIADLHSNAA